MPPVGPGPVGPGPVGPELQLGARPAPDPFPANPHLDVIVRNPDQFLSVPVPVGAVSKRCKVDFRRRHTPSLELGHVEWALGRGLRAADLERERFERWQEMPVVWPRLVRWFETTLAEKWGVLAAGRVLHIARTGRDARVATRRWRGPLAERPMIAADRVPGSAPPADTVYKVTQILAWLAGQTCEVAGRIQKRSQVVALVRRLARA